MIAEDPYKLALVCLKLCPDIYKNKGNGMAANVVVELQYFLNEHKEKYTSCLTEGMQKEVFQVAIKQKNTGMMRLLIKAYQLEDISEQLVPHLRDMIAQQRYKDVCTLATLLNLQGHFSTGELIIPLFCLDRLCLADEFLDSSPAHQKEILIFIDDLIGKQAEAQNVLKKFNIKDVKKFKSSKVLSNTAARLLKRFKMDMSICPHLYRRRAVGGLRFLFYKYYIEKGLQQSAFHSLVEDAVKESPDLKINLMYLFCEYCDPYAAVPYVAKLQMNSEDLPHQVKKAMLTSPPGNNSYLATNKPQEEEECWGGQDDNESYSLSLSLEKVIVVDTVSGFEDCVKDVCGSPVIGLDSEWKPSFGIGAAEQVALLQLATLTHVFLIDIVSLQPLLNHCHWRLLGQIFSDNRITKLGYGIKGDFKILAKVHTEFKKALANAKNVIDFDQKKAVILEAQSDMFSFSPSSYKGLSDLVYRCFGQPLNKNEQFSNWSNRPLTRSQELYAALDARCLIDIYNYLNAKAQELDIDDWINMKPKAPQAKSKNSKKMKMVASGSKNFFPVESKQRAVAAKEFHVVCDAMLQGLAKKLRLCGVDAIALENGQSSDDCIEFFEKDKRVVLSRGAAYQRLSKFIPSGYVYHVESERAEEQLVEVTQAFKVTLEPDDVVTRYTKCN